MMIKGIEMTMSKGKSEMVAKKTEMVLEYIVEKPLETDGVQSETGSNSSFEFKENLKILN